MPHKKKHLLCGIEDTHSIAERLAGILRHGDCVTLQGDLGAGKTSLVRKVIQELTDDEVAVISPTFTLVQTYDVRLLNGTQTVLWHYDLYRLEDEDDILELGLDEALERGIVMIEWPELVNYALPEDRIQLVLDFGEALDNRHLTISSPSAAVRERLEQANLC